MDSMPVDIAIVGAGMAGIAAARRAQELGLTYVVLEAADRIGGRVHTVDLENGEWWDTGCHELIQPPVNRLIAEADRLGIRYEKTWNPEIPVWLDGVQLDNRETDKARHEIDELDGLLHELAELNDDAPLFDLLDHESDFVSTVTGLLTLQTGADPSNTSALDRFARGSFEGEWPVYGGFGSLVTALASDIQVQVNSTVHVIDLGGDLVRLDLGERVIEAATALVTVSTGVLANDDLVFAPELPELHRRAIESLPMSRVIRALVTVSGSVPGGPGSPSIHLHSDAAQVQIVSRPTGQNLICASVIPLQDKVDQLEALIESAVLEAHGESLGQILGIEIVDWSLEPHMLGGWAVAVAGNFDARTALAESLEERVWFAGEATSIRSHATAHGAWQSGIDATDRIAFALGRLTSVPLGSDTDEVFKFDF